MKPACPDEINAACADRHQGGISEPRGPNNVLLLGRINFGFQVSNRPDTAARQLAAIASQLAYTGRQVLVEQPELHDVFCTLVAHQGPPAQLVDHATTLQLR